MGYFQVELQEKKNAYIKKNVQKNRKIVKNLLMYDKKNFLPHIQKKSPKKQNRPQQSKKTKKNEKNPKQPEKF
jgi:DNA polymerase IIIc chi subunit